jgi:molybdopterin-guanine dinucleotide biosynthesis protein A
LLNLALEALSPQCDAVAVVGRDLPGCISIRDWPASDNGPLGGLAGALRYAAQDYDQVLSVPVDAPCLPVNLRALLEPGPACVADQPVIGLWPVEAALTTEQILLRNGKHSMRALIAAMGARMIGGIPLLPNINTRHDLASVERALHCGTLNPGRRR